MIFPKKQSDLYFHTLENGDLLFHNRYIVPNEETKRKLKKILNTYFASASILIIPISLELVSFKYIIIYLFITTIIYYYKTIQITKTLKKTVRVIKPTFKEMLIKQSSIYSSISLWVLMIFSIVFSTFSIEMLLNEDEKFFLALSGTIFFSFSIITMILLLIGKKLTNTRSEQGDTCD